MHLHTGVSPRMTTKGVTSEDSKVAEGKVLIVIDNEGIRFNGHGIGETGIRPLSCQRTKGVKGQDRDSSG